VVTLIDKVRPVTLSMIKKYGYYDSFEENYQNAMVQLLEAIQEYDSSIGVSFPAFYKNKLFYFFMHVIKEQANKLDVEKNIADFDTLKDEHLLQEDKSLEGIIWRENREDIQESLKKLTDRQQWIIDECFYKGKRVQQVAEEYGLHPQTVSKLKIRALKKLKTVLLGKSVS